MSTSTERERELRRYVSEPSTPIEEDVLAGVEKDWSAYAGPHGGHGWRDSDTGEVRYQEEKPSEGEAGREPQRTTPSGPESAQTQRQRFLAGLTPEQQEAFHKRERERMRAWRAKKRTEAQGERAQGRGPKGLPKAARELEDAVAAVVREVDRAGLKADRDLDAYFRGEDGAQHHSDLLNLQRVIWSYTKEVDRALKGEFQAGDAEVAGKRIQEWDYDLTEINAWYGELHGMRPPPPDSVRRLLRGKLEGLRGLEGVIGKLDPTEVATRLREVDAERRDLKHDGKFGREDLGVAGASTASWDKDVVKKVLARLPSRHLRFVRSIRIEDGPNPADTFFAQRYGRPMHTVGSASSGQITLWASGKKEDENDAFNIIAHELGHLVAEAHFGTTDPGTTAMLERHPGKSKAAKAYMDAAQKDTTDALEMGLIRQDGVRLGVSGLTAYARDAWKNGASMSEDFAEAYAMYVMGDLGSNLEEDSEARWRWFNDRVGYIDLPEGPLIEAWRGAWS